MGFRPAEKPKLCSIPITAVRLAKLVLPPAGRVAVVGAGVGVGVPPPAIAPLGVLELSPPPQADNAAPKDKAQTHKSDRCNAIKIPSQAFF